MSKELVGKRVVCRYGAGPGTHAEGWAYGYSDRPTMLVVTDSGQDISWAAELTDKATGGLALPFGTCMARRDRRADTMQRVESFAMSLLNLPSGLAANLSAHDVANALLEVVALDGEVDQ